MVLHWTRFADLAQSTGFILLAILALWALMALAVYWAVSRGTASLDERVKFRVVEDDKPVSQGGGECGGHPT